MLKFILALFIFLFSSGLFAQQKKIAITIDDLPFVRSGMFSSGTLVQKTDSLLMALSRYHAPVTGFVNMTKVYNEGEFDSVQINLLRQWLGKGFDLGNHTFSHPDYNNVSFSTFAAEIEKNEQAMQPLLNEYNKTMPYFRHPFLHRGDSQAKADSLAQYLRSRKYTEAPVTIDNAEWIFAAAYDSVLKTNDQKLALLIGNEYISYMQKKLIFYEGQSVKLFGRNISHILLIHANSLNAANMDHLLSMFAGNGYAFVSLAEALTDKAYNSEDKYYRRGGISWLDRWAFTRGEGRDFFKGEPVCPAFVMKLAKVDSE